MREVINNMTTKKELQAIVDLQKKELRKISAQVEKIAGSKKEVITYNLFNTYTTYIILLV